jgi:hypothetical protein
VNRSGFAEVNDLRMALAFCAVQGALMKLANVVVGRNPTRWFTCSFHSAGEAGGLTDGPEIGHGGIAAASGAMEDATDKLLAFSLSQAFALSAGRPRSVGLFIVCNRFVARAGSFNLYNRNGRQVLQPRRRF